MSTPVDSLTHAQDLARAKEQLLQSETRFQSLLDASPVPQALNNDALQITYLNPAFVQTFGYTLQDIPTITHWWPLAYPEPTYAHWVQTTWFARIDETKRTGQAFRPMEAKIRSKDGSDRFVLASAATLGSGFSGLHLVQLCDITERVRNEQLLLEREQRFRDLLESTEGIVWEADAQTFGFISVSENAKRILGYPTEDWLQPGFWASHIHPDDREQAIAHCAACTGRLEDHDFEYRFIASDSRVVWLRDIVRVVAVDGKARWLRGLMVDVSAQKQVEIELKMRAVAQREAATALAIAAELQERTGELAQVGGWQVDLQSMKLTWTRETFRIAEVQGTVEPPLEDGINLFAPEARATISAAVQAAMDTGTPYDLELPIIGALGTHKWVRTQGFAVMQDGKAIRLHGTFQDITQRKQAELHQAELLAEKTALLNEVHHRVKNNLQVISSLLRLEAARAGRSGSNAQAVLGDMQGRIRSMALLHETLYRSGSFAAVNLGSYLGQLSQQAWRLHAPNGSPVRLQLDLAPVSVNLDKATPIGLLLNELIANCFKHGFPDGRRGTVHIGLEQMASGRCSLTVQDDGVGLPEDFAQKCDHSLGMQLVSDLSRQIGGELSIGSGPGGCFTLVFDCHAEESL